MDAKVLQSCAVLEEFLQEEYVGVFDKIDETKETRIENFIENDRLRKYLQISVDGSYFFIGPDDFNEYYFIDKKGLPKEIRDSVVGGETDISGKTMYASFEDIYGITKDLRVFYCNGASDGKVVSLGAEPDASKTDLNKKVFDKSDSWSQMLGHTESDTTFQEIKSKDTLTITRNDLDLTKLVYFTNLNYLIFSNSSYSNLNGIELAINLKYVRLEGDCSGIVDFSNLANVGKLQYLYIIDQSQETVDRIMSNENGIGGKDIESLDYLAITGSTDSRYWCNNGEEGRLAKNTYNVGISSIKCLNNLSEKTGKSIYFLDISINKLTNLDGIQKCTNLNTLKVNGNLIVSLKELEVTKLSLESLLCSNNNLGNEIEESSDMKPFSKTDNCDSLSVFGDIKDKSKKIEEREFTVNFPNLKNVYLDNNQNLIWFNYLRNYSLTNLSLIDCKNLSEKAVTNGRDFLIALGRPVDSKYSLLLLDINSTSLDLNGMEVSRSVFEEFSTYKNLSKFNFCDLKIRDDDGTIITDEDTLNSLVSNLIQNYNTKIVSLELKNWKNFSDISFLGKKDYDKLDYLDLYGTSVSTENSSTGLQVLNTSCPRLKSLIIPSNVSIDLSLIQGAINKVSDSLSMHENKGDILQHISGAPWGAGYGLLCYDSTVLKTLEKCADLENLFCQYQGYNTCFIRDLELDLSKCTSLRKIRLHHLYIKKLSLGEKVEGIGLCVQGGGALNLSKASNLEIIICSSGWDFVSGLKELPVKNKFKNIYSYGFDSDDAVLEALGELGNLTELQNIYLGREDWMASSNINLKMNTIFDNLTTTYSKLTTLTFNRINLENVDISNISKFTALEKLTITNCNINNLNWLSSEFSSLKELDCSYNNINCGMSKIALLPVIENVNLINNKIGDLATDEETYKVEDLFYYLNYQKGGSVDGISFQIPNRLKALKLSGNQFQKPLTKLSELSWPDGKSGF